MVDANYCHTCYGTGLIAVENRDPARCTNCDGSGDTFPDMLLDDYNVLRRGTALGYSFIIAEPKDGIDDMPYSVLIANPRDYTVFDSVFTKFEAYESVGKAVDAVRAGTAGLV